MIPVPTGVRVWIATGHTDMRRYAEHRIMLSPRQRCEPFSNIFSNMRYRTLQESSA